MTEPVEPISLPPIYVGEEPPDGISLPSPNESSGLPLPDDIAQQRAQKTEMGLGSLLQKTTADLKPDFVAGNEELIRRRAASELDLQNEKQKQKMVEDLFRKKEGAVSSQMVMDILDPFTQKPNVDPETVIEKAYSSSVISSLNTAKSYMGDSILDKAKVEIPEQTQQTLDTGDDLLTKNQYLLKKIQDIQQTVDEQSWVGWGADQLKGMTQIYPEYKQRGLVDNTYFSGLALGSNKEEQSNLLYRKPFDDFKKTVDAAAEYLAKDNPSLAVSFLKSMYGQDTFEKTLDNAFSALAIPDAIVGVKLAAAVSSKFSRLNQVRKATKDIVDAAAQEPLPTAKTMAEGAGDVRQAVVETMAQRVEAALAGGGDPIKVAKDALLTTWKEDADKFGANQGTYLSRELLTRIQDGFVRDGEDLINKIITMNRVERTPVAVTSREVIDAYIDQIKSNFKGPANTLADVQGPIREPISGTYWYKSKIVNYDGTQFPDVETAKGFANQLGLANPVIKGAEAETVYLPATAVKNLEAIKSKGGVTRFFVDKDIEVMATPTPQGGLVPYNLKTGKFGAQLTDQTASVAQQGLGFHIEQWTPMREGDNLIRDLMIYTPSGSPIKDAISTSSASGINSIKNSLLGWVRNSDDTLSVNESAQRKAVTYTQSNIQLWAKGLYKDLEDIASGRVREDPVTGQPLSPMTYYPKSWTSGKIKGRKVAQEFERTLDEARRMVDPATGEDGYFFKTAGELQDFYNRSFQRDPSYLETRAYFNYVKLIEGDRAFAEIAEFRNRARIGSEQHSITVLDPKTGERIKSPFFDGVIQTDFPGGDENILILGRVKGDETLHQLGHINDKSVKSMRENVRTGKAKVIQIYDRDHMPMSSFSEVADGKLVSYVYTELVETKPLQFNHVERRGGGHFEWDYDHYLKQADVRPQYNGGNINDKRPSVQNAYVGDTTVMPIKNRKLGQDVAKLWNEAQALIREKRWDEVRPIAAKLGINYEEFTSWYHPGRDSEGKVTKPRLNPNEPIQVVPKNRKISDLGSDLQDRYRIKKADGNYMNTFMDMTKSGPANNFKVAYNTERNESVTSVKTINDLGTQGNPLYAHQPADMVDPLTTMNRALNRAISNAFMDDYKIYGVEHWLREAEKYIDAGENSINKIRSSPFYYFNNPKWLAGTPNEVKWNLESNRFKIQQFVGTPNKFDTWVHSLTTQMADNFYAKYGPEGSRTIGQKAVSIVPIWMLHHVTDPVSFMRSVTFNFKLGLGAIPQFLVQAQTHSLIWALEPKHGTVGTYSMLLHGWSEFAGNPTILAHLDNMATKMNMFGSRWKPGEWLEARRELENSGFKNVAGEYSNLNNQLKTKHIQNDFDKGLKIGQYPFRLGEESTRVTAWYTAFREFRELNPTTPITNIERSKILSKADLLTVNMSRASSSALNHGVFSLSTQFLTYQIKLAELFWGKRLGETLTERNLARARIVGVFGALYGIPNAIGVTGAPFSDNLREHFMDDLGYIPGEKWTSTLVNEGIPAWSYAMIFGQLPNVGDRFGSQGFQNVKQALRGDIPWWQAIGGAATATFAKTFSSAFDPFYQMGVGWAQGTDPAFKLKSADLVEPLKEISAYSTASKWWTAMQTGKWVNKNEGNVTDVTPLQATLLSLTGMSPQEQDDAFITNQMLKGEIESQKGALKDFIKDWRRGIEAMNNGDPEQAKDFQNNAMSRLAVTGYPMDKILSAIAIANRGWENAIDTAAQRMLTDGNQNKSGDRLDRYKRQLDMKKEQ